MKPCYGSRQDDNKVNKAKLRIVQFDSWHLIIDRYRMMGYHFVWSTEKQLDSFLNMSEVSNI